MATTSIIAVGNTAQASADITLVAGATSTVSLRPATTASVALPADAQAQVQYKTSDGGYVDHPDGRLSATKPSTIIEGPKVFRVITKPSVNSFGVDQD